MSPWQNILFLYINKVLCYRLTCRVYMKFAGFQTPGRGEKSSKLKQLVHREYPILGLLQTGKLYQLVCPCWVMSPRITRPHPKACSLHPWRWRKLVPTRNWGQPTSLRGVTAQKTRSERTSPNILKSYSLYCARVG